MKNIPKLQVSWEGFNLMYVKLATSIKNSRLPIKQIYGIPRGGLILAVILSHYLEVPLSNKITKNTLIVDDISDSGETFLKFKRKYRNILTASLLIRKSTKFVPNYFVKSIDKDWVVFPWELLTEKTEKDNTNV